MRTRFCLFVHGVRVLNISVEQKSRNRSSGICNRGSLKSLKLGADCMENIWNWVRVETALGVLDLLGQSPQTLNTFAIRHNIHLR